MKITTQMRDTILAAIFLSGIGLATPCSAQGKVEAGLRIEVKNVSLLPHLVPRYQSMKLIPKGQYQDWQTSQGSVFGKKVVESPKQVDGVFVEALALITNVSTNDQTFQFKSPKLELSGGRTISPWEYLFAGSVQDYDGLASYLQFPDKPPEKDSDLTIQLMAGGDFYCALKEKQQTWIILIFQVPKETRDATLVIGGYSPVSFKIPPSKK